jgi:PQQ-dependent dehydrogenase (methanol/ethanol family)
VTHSFRTLLLFVCLVLFGPASLSCSREAAEAGTGDIGPASPPGAPGPEASYTAAGKSLAPSAGHATPDTNGVSSSTAHGGDWPLPGRDPQGTRYSPLDLITPANVKDLKAAWTFSTGYARGFEGQPLVVDGTMYVVAPYPNKVFALDLSKPEGPLKWAYTPPTDPASQGVACCDVVNRGASYADGKIVFNRLDAHTVALDAKTGKVVWDTKVGDINLGETTTMAPLVVKDKVLVGNSGGEMGVRGWIEALDLGSGRLLWKGWSTGPDADVLIGKDFRPAYEGLRGRDLGVRSWPADQWKLGGGNVWGWVSYDPELDLVFYGTANPGVWNPDMRPGDNLWATSVIARDPDTGQARWAYQLTPHDSWDYDAVNESIPVDLEIGGQVRRVVVHFDRNGFAYTIDRATGEVLIASPFEYLNWARGVDGRTGRPSRVTDKETHQGLNVQNICPSAIGGRDQQPAAFSPRTRLFYTPTAHLCMDYRGMEANYIAGTPYLGADVWMYAGPDGHRGKFIAWDAATGRKVWGIPEEFPVWSGALATAGDLVFYGTMDGWFKAVDARTGQLLWKFKLGSGVVGNPIAFLGPDGKEYVAIYAGIGGWAGAVALGLSPDDPTGALGAIGATGDLPKYTAPGGTVYVFGL